MVEITNYQIFNIEQPPTLCCVGLDGSVKWYPEANPESIMKLRSVNSLGLLALWYATSGEDRPAIVR